MRAVFFEWQNEKGETMKGFIYNGKSTKDIISSSELILASFNGLDDVTGSSRESIKGEVTAVRMIANEYGIKYSPLIFEYSLIKMNGEVFTEEEQVIVEKWLTSPKLSQDLKLFDIDTGNVETIYCGKFVSTTWKAVANGWAGITFSFENNHAYPKRHFENTYTIRAQGNITIGCETDELEEYIYPVLTITEPNETGYITIKNITDNSNTMRIRAYESLPIIFDCRHCIVKDSTSKGIVSYSDLGWNDVGNIYWLRLLPGINNIQVIGNANITISYDCPFKKVGGWI